MQSASDCLECVGPTCDLTAPLRSGAPSLYKQIVASTVGSSVAVLTLNPITVIKVHLQKAAPGVSIVSVVRGIGRDRGFWRGSSVGLMQALPNSVLYMSIYEDLKRRLATTMPPAYSSLSPGLAGGLARIVCVTAMSPLEVIRTAQTGGASSSLAELARDIIRNRGLSGFYSGWGSTLARDAPFSAIYWFAFDLLRPVWNGGEGGVHGGESFSNIATFCAGASSSMIAAVCTHPFDVLKTQHQLSVAKAGAAVGNVSLSSLVRAGGVLGLYRGLSMRLATVIPGSALMVTIYEWVKANV
jgi:solute carrier family 25 protein 39/40